MERNRRNFIKTAAAGAGWAMLGGCASTIQSCQEIIERRPVRRNIASLGPNDPIIEAYRAAVRAMKALPSTDRRNWTNQALIHQSYCPHENWLFLPWHRCYLLYFERICRKLSGMEDFALPYWNWSEQPQIPSAFFASTFDPLFDPTRLATPTSTAAASAVGPSVLAGILDEPNFLVFGSGPIPASASQRRPSYYGPLEGGPHNYIHGFVGGNMSTYMSPLDPLFWLHHNMVERTWVHWNLVREHPNTEDRAWLDREFTEFCDEDGNPVTISVALSLLFPVISYRYDDEEDDATMGAAVAPAAAIDPAQAAKDRAMWLRLSGDTKAERDANAARAQQGARVDLQVLERIATSTPLSAALDQPAVTRLMVDPPLLELARRGRDVRALLAFEGVGLDFTTDFSVRVFLNHPGAGPDTPPSDPHFVGTFASFHHAHGPGAAGVGTFLLDVGPTIERLGLEEGPLEVSLVLAPFPDREPTERTLEVARIELQIGRDVIEVVDP